MFGKFLRVLPCLLALHGLVAQPTPEVRVVGTGPDVSYVVIQESSLSATPLIFAYHYTFASNPPLTGYGLLSQICAANPDLQIATTQYSFGKSLDAFDYGGRTVSASTGPDGNSGTYWSYYVSGGYDGAGAIGSNTWGYSQFGFESRTIVPGSCDGWTFANWEGTNEPSDVPPALEVTNIASLVAAAAPTPTPSPTPTPVPTPGQTNPLAISVGVGPDVSFVVIQSEGLSPRPLVFAYHYTNAAGPPMTGYGLLMAIRGAVSDFDFATTQYSFGKSLDAFRYQGTTVTSSSSPDGNSGLYWSYYLYGGYDGTGAVPTNGWSYSQFGFESRTITPGSCDGWTLASWEGTNGMDVPPTIDPAFLATLAGNPRPSLTGAASPTPSANPTSTPMAKTVAIPAGNPATVANPTASPSPAPIGTNGGGAFYGGPIPSDAPQSRGGVDGPSRRDTRDGNSFRAEGAGDAGISGNGSPLRSFSTPASPFVAVAGGGAYSPPEWFHPTGFVSPVGDSSLGGRPETPLEKKPRVSSVPPSDGLLSSYRQAISGSEPPGQVSRGAISRDRGITPESGSGNPIADLWNRMAGHLNHAWKTVRGWFSFTP